MRRETSNRIRFILEDLIPPILKDSLLFRWLAELIWGKHIRELAEFRRRAPFLSPQEYEALYRAHPRVHEGTDNSEACIRKIITELRGASVCDIGCGTGQLLQRIRAGHPVPTLRLVGVDFVISPGSVPADIELVAARIEQLPFADGEFDTVICTHVLEHILDLRKALFELRRIARQRLIIVVPRERETRYTFNPHFHFFAYPESFLRAAIPIPKHYECLDIARDIYYREDLH